MIEPDAILQSLQAVGMSAYEAKAYVALVASGEPINGYEVAKRSGVPRSTVYETLGKLLARGAAFEVRSDDETTLYVALPADALLRRLREQFDGQLEQLSASLPQVRAPVTSHVLHTLEGREAVLDRARDLLDLARAVDRRLGLDRGAPRPGAVATAGRRSRARDVDHHVRRGLLLHRAHVPTRVLDT